MVKPRQGCARQLSYSESTMKTKTIQSFLKIIFCSVAIVALFAAPPAAISGAPKKETPVKKEGAINVSASLDRLTGNAATAPANPRPHVPEVMLLTQNFDGVVPPALPAGWTATNAVGGSPLWVTSNSGVPAPVADSPPNAAFVNDPPSISDKRLDSPSFMVNTPAASVTFRNNYNLESGGGFFYDGGVLEISINGSSFDDITAVGGSFVAGAYNGTISTSFSNPLGGRMAWSASSGGFITSTANLPPAAAGQMVVLRWRMGSDNSTTGQGWRIDNVVVSEPACPNDVAATAFVVPANNSGVPNGGSIMPQASFMNVGGAPQNNVMVKFVITGPGGYNYNDVEMIPAINPNQQQTVIFAATPVFTMTGSYNMNAMVMTPDCNPANDAINGAFQVNNPLSGTITVGNGGDYATLTGSGGVFDTLNHVGLSGDLEVAIISDITNETGEIPLNQWMEVNEQGGLHVTIRPRGMLGARRGGVPRTISGTSTGSGLIKLNGADRVTINGSLTDGGSDRSLTITNGNANAAVVWIASASASNGANNDTVKNCNISGSPGVIAVAGILSGSGTTLGNDAEAPNNSITVQNNNIFRVQNSCYLRGSTGATDTGIVVTGNNFGSSVPADKNIFRGILIANSSGFTIGGNTISGVVSLTSSTAKMTGIQTALVINNGLIERNTIKDIKQLNTGTYGAAAIDLTGGNNILVRNNFISDINHDNSGGAAFSLQFGVFGIEIEAGTGHRIYNNSVNLFGSIGTNNNSSLLDAAFALGATTDTNCDVRDNIFANNITGGTTSIAHVAIYLLSGGTSAMNLTENNNSYYNGTDSARQGVGQAGTTAGTNFFVTLPQLQAYSMTLSPSGTNDSDSIAPPGPIPFVSANDLHLLCGAPETDWGISLAAVPNDIDMQPRDPNTPDLGADEQIVPVATSMVSRLVHGAAGSFDIPLPGVESRSAGGNYQIVYTFPSPVTFSAAEVTSGTGTVMNATGSGTNTITVNLQGVIDVQYVALDLMCVSDGMNTGDVAAQMLVLIGDTTANSTVNAGDVGQTKSRLGQPVNTTNFRSDVNANGSINAGDVGLVKLAIGHGAGPPPPIGKCWRFVHCRGPSIIIECMPCFEMLDGMSWKEAPNGPCMPACQ